MAHILITTKTTFFDIDKLVATIALAKALETVDGNDVQVYLAKQPPKELERISKISDLPLSNEFEANVATLSIDKGNAEITDVKWDVIDGKLNLQIITDHGRLKLDQQQVSLAAPSFDKVVAVGIKTLSELQSHLGENAGIWDAASETVNIDLRAENDQYAKANHIDQSAKSFSECVFTYLQANNIVISAEIATELLSGIYWKTNSLRNKYATAHTFSVIPKLIEIGGDLREAANRTFSSTNLLEMRSRVEMFKNLNITANGIALSKLSLENAKQLLRIQPINPDKNPLAILADVHASFVLIPINETSTMVLCSAHDQSINLRKTFGGFNYVGDELQAELTFAMSIDETEQEIERIVGELNLESPSAEKLVPEPASSSAPAAELGPEMSEMTTIQPDKEELQEEGVVEAAETELQAANTPLRVTGEAGDLITADSVEPTVIDTEDLSLENQREATQDEPGDRREEIASPEADIDFEATSTDYQTQSAENQTDEGSQDSTEPKPTPTQADEQSGFIDADPLAPAAEPLVIEEDEEAEPQPAMGGMFGGFGGAPAADPLPKAKSK